MIVRNLQEILFLFHIIYQYLGTTFTAFASTSKSVKAQHIDFIDKAMC